jgi:hypothetical protein
MSATEQTTKNCWGCVHRASRMRGSTPRSWCKRYKTTTTERCIDYTYKPKAVSQALQWFKRMAIK